MDEQQKEPVINPEDTYENEDVKTIEAMKADFDLKMAQQQKKYSSMLKYFTEGGKAEESAPEITPEEKMKALNQKALDFRDGKLTTIQKMETLLEYDDHVVNDLHGRSIFVPESGELTPEITQSAERVKELIRSSIEKAEGDDETFAASVTAKLVDVV